ncbi:histidine--tRNA ligase [Oxalobacter sp. OttesenSCG-928-P03]|nr:histidine--tRNA ligase [Oxalobacter sp. OttesenSCG-928-P03]
MSEEKKANKNKKILGIKGMNDILPEDAPVWELLENTTESVLKSYGYQRIRTPIVEETALFARGLGAVTDIVEKEMYSFEDALNGDNLTLRPESTAGVVRAVVEHNLTYNGPKRLWYSGPMFRHERPQRGRYRQFHQIGAEALGFGGPDIDAELIMLCQRLWDDLGLEKIRLEINSIGNAQERNRHRADLIAYFEKNSDVLDQDAQRRLYSNPLRILDTKNPAMQEMVNGAPKLLDYLDEESLRHFEGLQKILRHNNIPYSINPRLVRGMDYYNRTVFEWISDELGSQGTICGGGRYDPLFEMFGGRPTPSCGFALGVERLIDLMKTQGGASVAENVDVYIVHQGEEAMLEAFVLAEVLRGTGLDVILHCSPAASGSSFKAQMKRADDSGATFAILLGEDELKGGNASVKALRSPDPENNQSLVPLAHVADYLVDQIIGEHPDEDEHGCGCGGLCSAPAHGIH